MPDFTVRNLLEANRCLLAPCFFRSVFSGEEKTSLGHKRLLPCRGRVSAARLPAIFGIFIIPRACCISPFARGRKHFVQAVRPRLQVAFIPIKPRAASRGFIR